MSPDVAQRARRLAQRRTREVVLLRREQPAPAAATSAPAPAAPAAPAPQ